MRKQFCDAMVARGADPRLVFLTGDLGFMALEPLQQALGERFVNAGVAEQNMVSVGAALARTGLEAWVYSIAPFVTARPFEQIRNDVALHGLPVRIVGNGGGFGYGVQGPTHHAIEDYGTLLALHGMQAVVPAFDQDVEAAVRTAGDAPGPAYLRLGRGEPPAGWTPPPFAPWRRLVRGGGPVVAVAGPLAGTYVGPLEQLPEATRPELWVASVMPVAGHPPPPELLARLEATGALVVAEEHVAHGGFGSALLLHLAAQGRVPARLRHLHAAAPTFERYGSQAYLRRRSGLDPAALLAAAAAVAA